MIIYYIKKRIKFANWVLQRMEPTEMTQYTTLKKKIKFPNWALQRMEPTEGHYIGEL